MCGICGFVTPKNIGEEILSSMVETLWHRGPDDGGTCLLRHREFRIGFGHRRLSILDISAAGHQPMFSADGKVGIVYNGEVYNFKELRRDLLTKGYLFHSDCDTEVILNAYLEEGISCVEKLNGMFAFALLDIRKGGDIYFARDRMGKKPLYIYQDAETLVFASELKALLRFPGFRKEIRTELLARYLYHGYFDGADTVFRDVHRVRPGQIWHLKLELPWHVEERCYWHIPSLYESLRNTGSQTREEAKAELKELLCASVCQRLVADVPVGTFLSGGIDSSLISAVAQECSPKPIKTYCIGFKEEKYDEARYAEAIAKHLGTEHHTLYVDGKNFADMCANMCWYYDEPFADSSQIPTMLVSRFAREDVTVALSGDGGDELFCGYAVYDRIRWMDSMAPLIFFARLAKKPLSWLARCKYFPPRWRKGCALLANPISITQGVSAVQEEWLVSIPKGEQRPIVFLEKELSEENLQIRRMLLDMETYLPDDILTKVDRASMRFSLECRSPLLDPAVVRFALALPQRLKYQDTGQQKKIILRDLLADYVPRRLFERPKKGFSIPIISFLSGSKFLKKITEKKRIDRQGIFNSHEIEKIQREFARGEEYSISVFWAYYVFQAWYEQFIGEL